MKNEKIQTSKETGTNGPRPRRKGRDMIKKETRKVSPNKKDLQINVRLDPMVGNDLEFLKRKYPDISVGNIVRFLITEAAKKEGKQ